MIYLKKFNESNNIIDKYSDFLFSYFDQDPSFIDSGDDWVYFEYYNNNITEYMCDNCQVYLDGPRFSGCRSIVDSDNEGGCIYIIIIKDRFYENHFKVSDIIWEEHELKKGLSKLTIDNLDIRNIYDDAQKARNLPKGSLIKGSIFNGMEIFTSEMEDPIRIFSDVQLQYILYKYAI